MINTNASAVRDPHQDESPVAAPPGTSPLPARPLGSARRWLGSTDPATPATRAAAGPPTGPVKGIPVAAVEFATTASCSATLVQRHRLQLVHDPRTGLHHAMTMP